MIDLLLKPQTGEGVPVPLPGRVIYFAGPGGEMLARQSSGAIVGAQASNVGPVAAGLRRGTVLQIDKQLTGVRQVFGEVDLSGDAGKTEVKITVPLLLRINSASAGLDADLFVRVAGGSWIYWDTFDVSKAGPGVWITTKIEVHFVLSEGYLCGIVGTSERIFFGNGLIEWSVKLQAAVDDAKPIAALVRVE